MSMRAEMRARVDAANAARDARSLDPGGIGVKEQELGGSQKQVTMMAPCDAFRSHLRWR
jgi:hypothetical protein